MTNDLSPVTPAEPATRRGPTAAMIARWMAIVALVVSVALVVPYLASGSLVGVAALALAFLAAVVGLVLCGRARRSGPSPRRAAMWALVSAVVAVVVDAVLAIVFVAGLAAFRVDRVELLGQGPDNISATFSNDLETRTISWPGSGRARFNTKGTWAEITITAPAGSATTKVSCQIVWNDEVVIDKTSDSGTVNCRYDQD